MDGGPLDERRERLLGTLMVVLALGCGAWALWPAVFPSPRVPSVTHAALPPLQTAAAPGYRETASITPLISGRLNLNAATQEQLEALPRIGPALAGRIVAARPLHSLADLDGVQGIGPSLMKTLTPLVSF